MSLTVVLRSCVNLRGKCDRLARITFRGVTYQSSIYENCSEAEWDEEYEWPLVSPLDPSEFIEVEVFNFNKIFNNRLVGVFRMVLQKLIQDGSLEIQESLVDSNNTVLKAQVILDLQYHPPDGNADSGWDSGILPAPVPISGEPIEQPYQPLILDRDHADGTMSERSFSTTQRMTDAERRQSHINLEMFNRPAGRPPSMPNIPMQLINGGIMQDTDSNLNSSMKRDSLPSINNQNLGVGNTEISVVGPFDKMWKQEGGSRRESFAVSEVKGHSHPRVRERKKESVKEQDYQVQVRVLECRQLAGTQLDPVCTVTVGNQKKHTAVKEQTNCPYWDEFFVFDFKMPSSVLFDKIINLQVFTGRNLVSQGALIGSFKLDVGTVYAQMDHRFCRRWAVLTDPEETLGASGAGVKGYLKVDITVLGKGDPVKEAPAIKDNDEDIEGNLLLPEGVPAERPKAQIVVKIYRAEGLPKMNSGLMANVKKAFTGEVRDLADPYVEVSFAGHKQRTSVKKHTYEPAWNEQVVFAELFPPLCRRIRVQLKDSDSVSDEVIGSHFIDLSAISNDGANGWNGDLYRPVPTGKSHKKRKADRLSSSADVGFMPTFGPCWVNLYGSTRDYSLFDEHNDLNNGLGEGVSYRGRLLMALQAETGESASDSGIKQVEVEAAAPISETAAGKEEQFQLFACLYEASMIDRKVGDKNIQFEMTIGNYGNQLDRTEVASKEVEENPFLNSLSPPARPVTNNRQYYHIPWDDSKPCLHIKFPWQDHRRRLYNANIVYKICERFEDGLVDILERVKMDLPDTYKWLSRVLGELINGCTNYLNLMKSVPAAAHIGRTKLDQERLKLCNYEIEAVMQAASDLKVICKDDSHTKENMKTANGLLQRLLNIASEPQDSLPDIFVWMLCGNKRVAYTRIPAQHVLYSLVEEERGKDSGRMQTLFLRLPGKRGEGPKGWAIQSKLNIMIWLGLHKHKKDYLKDAPKGYDMPRNAHKLMAPPPNDLVYKVKQKFVLRSHLYQARSLIGSDASGLSDAFAKVIFTHFIAETRVIWETRSPTWDQTIIFEDIYLWGDVNEIAVNPPTIVVEIFDKDIGGDSEFIGRALARPIVKMACEPYEKPFFPPALEWFQIFRGEEKAGELLAAFELLQVTDGTTHMPPEVEPVNTSDGPICPVPEGIRPVMKKHRIEVLFWGVREMKRLNLQTVDRPQVDIECAGRVIQSTVIANARRNPNFQNPVDFFDVELPENERYCPPLTVRVRDCRTFGRFSLVGTHVLNSLHRYRYPIDGVPIEKASIKDVTEEPQTDPNAPAQTQDVAVNIEEPAIGEDAPPDKPEAQDAPGPGGEKKKKKEKEEDEEDDSEDTLDWWSRYYETMKFIDAEADIKSKEEKKKKEKKEQEKEGKDDKKDKKDKKKEKNVQPEVAHGPERKKNIPLIEIYRTELDNVQEFNNFNDWLHSFSLYRGKKTSEEDDDEHRVVGKFKGSLKVWQYPMPENVETDPVIGTFRKLPSNEPVNVLVRVYVVKALNLHPSDPNGKADPYPVVTLGKQKVRDRDNYISKQLNPIFGRTFEFEALIPMDSILTVGVYDWDLVGSDDLIGETKIDLENRFYSKHRATCGLQEQFATFGFNKWRDPQRPTHILAKLCKDESLDGPHYNNGKVQVDGVTFRAPGQVQDESGNWKQSDEPAALMVLRNMHKVIRGHHLVPEHVETRSLFCPDKPGVEQGQIEMWVDMFPRDMQSPGAPVDITPRKPTSYELRIIVWNTDEVVMDDTNVITGERCSDIFVKGWIEGMKDEKQETDVHYKSMTGEGNFNWRLIFPFNYQRAEERIIITRKASFFSWDESEEKVPPRIVLQVWDADAFSADDFIGDLALDLNRMPRGAKSVKTCNLDMAKKDGTIPHISLFKLKHMRGWWPFTVNTDLEEIELAGKLEAEFELLTEEEAEKKPAGKGREEPEPLPKPNRPDTSFVWFMNPLKSLRYMLWNNYKMCIVKFLVIFLLLALMGLFFYSMPGYTVKKIFNA